MSETKNETNPYEGENWRDDPLEDGVIRRYRSMKHFRAEEFWLPDLPVTPRLDPRDT